MKVKHCSIKNLWQFSMFMGIVAGICLDPVNVNAFTDSSPVPLPFHDTSVVPIPPQQQAKIARTFFLKKYQQEQKAKEYQLALIRQLEEFNQRQDLKRVHKPSAIEITYQDMVNTYAFNADFLEYYAFPKNITMDMGNFDPDLATSQNWVMPQGLDLIPIKRKIVDPKTTPYVYLAPEATHCLFFDSPRSGGDVYQYYMLDEDGLWDVGREVEKFNYAEDEDSEVFPLPLDVNTLYYSGYGMGVDSTWTAYGDTTWYTDTDYGVEYWYYMSEAYGTLETTDDGPVQVIKIAFQWIWTEWEVDEDAEEDALIDFANGTEIYFYSKDGHQLAVSLDSLDAETIGVVKPDRIYYQKVQKANTHVSRKQKLDMPVLSFYPNPTRGLINFNSPASVDIMDILGRRVCTLQNAQRANLSHLPAGAYFMKPATGKAQKFVIQK